MDSSNRRVGRPKTALRTGPLVLGEGRNRERIEIELSGALARELAEYAAWVELSSSLTTAAAMGTTIEFALREVFRRDRVWQERRRAGERRAALALGNAAPVAAVATAAPAATARAAGASPSPPPPSGGAGRPVS